MTDEPMIDKLEPTCSCFDDMCDLLHDPDCPCDVGDHFAALRVALAALERAEAERDGALRERDRMHQLADEQHAKLIAALAPDTEEERYGE